LSFYYTNEITAKKADQTKSLIEQHKPFKNIKISTIDSILKLQTLCV